jgi:hypothetical protein
VQHLPGLLEQVTVKGLFVSFPDENAQAPSKGELKRLAKKGGSGKPENPAQNNKEAANKGKKSEGAPKENNGQEESKKEESKKEEVKEGAPAEAKPKKEK